MVRQGAGAGFDFLWGPGGWGWVGLSNWRGSGYVLARRRRRHLCSDCAAMGLWLLRSRPGAAARSGASTPAASRGEASQRHHGAAASQTRSRTLPPRHGAASRTPPRPQAARRTPPAASRRARQRAATDRREQAAAEAPLHASTPERVRHARPGANRRDDPELYALVGPACETAEAHEARHPGFGHHQTCPRCRFYKIGPSWVGAYGYECAPCQGPDKVQWLDERPSHWGGALGTGLHHLRSRN